MRSANVDGVVVPARQLLFQNINIRAISDVDIFEIFGYRVIVLGRAGENVDVRDFEQRANHNL